MIALLALAFVAMAFAAPAFGDGMIVPVRPEIRVAGNWAVKYHHVAISVRDQVASVSIDQEFVNLSSSMMEVEYLFPVPPDAAIDSMTLVVNGKEFAAKLLKADEARRIYEEIVRRKKDPALLEYVGFGLVKTSAFPLEPGKPAHVLVTYKNVCKKDRDLVSVWYPLNTEKYSAKAIDDVEVSVDIKSAADITAIYSPSHDLTTERKGARHVKATYHAKDTLPTQDFQVFYKEANEDVGATLMTQMGEGGRDGYFMLLASPNPASSKAKVAPKDVLVVLDRSGSMSENKKLEQAKEALRFVLRNLNKNDRFNVISYNDSVEPFFDEMTEVSKKKVDEAMERVDSLEPAGGTNIHEAMSVSMRMLAGRSAERMRDGDNEATVERGAPNRPRYIIFLTDGRPTVGKTDEDVIIRDTTRANKESGARLFTFGVGYDVNVRLLDKLVGENNGRSDYVKPNEPIEGKISSLYSKIRNPVMTNLKIEVQGLKLRDMYPRQLPDLFEGDQIVLVGRFDRKDLERLPSEEKGVCTTTLVIKGIFEGRERGFEYPVTIQSGKNGWRYDFVEKLWAVRRVGFLLDEIQLHGKNQEIVDELVRLSRDYGIMTPYTSFLADETTRLDRPADVSRKADVGAASLSEVTGASGQVNAKNRQELNVATATPPSTWAPAKASGPGGKDMKGGVQVFGNRDKEGYEQAKKETVGSNMQIAGNQAMYRRGNMWMTPDTAQMDLAKDKDKIKVIDRFSDEYFELVRANTTAQNQVMATQGANEELLVNLRGQVYRIR